MPSAYINLSFNPNKSSQPQWPDSSHRNQIRHVPSHQGKKRTLQPLRLQEFLDLLAYFEERELAVRCSSPLTPQSQKVFETAVKLNIPVIIHTGNGVPCALPSLAIPVAKANPELSIVLAHSGAGMYGAEALIAAHQCPNITLETSLTTVMDIPSFIRKLGAERVMFGTDIPLNASAELGKYKALHLTEEPYAWVHEGTARRVFRL